MLVIASPKKILAGETSIILWCVFQHSQCSLLDSFPVSNPCSSILIFFFFFHLLVTPISCSVIGFKYVMTYQDAVTPVVVLWTKNSNNTLLAVHISQPFLMVRCEEFCYFSYPWSFLKRLLKYWTTYIIFCTWKCNLIPCSGYASGS